MLHWGATLTSGCCGIKSFYSGFGELLWLGTLDLGSYSGKLLWAWEATLGSYSGNRLLRPPEELPGLGKLLWGATLG